MEELNQHPVYSNPLKTLSLLDKFANIILCNGTTLSGFINSIDPVSGSVVLAVPEDDRYNVIWIMGHVVKDISVREIPDEIKAPVHMISEVSVNVQACAIKKEKVMSWLSKNLLPVHDNAGVIEVHDGSLLIHPPYDSIDCSTDNTVVMGRIQHLLRNMPS